MPAPSVGCRATLGRDAHAASLGHTRKLHGGLGVESLVQQGVGWEAFARASGHDRCKLEMTLPEVSGPALTRLATVTRFICSFFIKDGASANLRLQVDVGHDLPPNVLLVSGACDIHRVYRAIAMVLAGQGIIGPLYSLSHLLRISDYWYKLMQGVCRTVASERIVIHDTPDPTHQQWAKVVLDHTLFRACRTRARSHEQWAGHAGHEGHGGLGGRGLAKEAACGQCFAGHCQL
jgi:hypothetical protein